VFGILEEGARAEEVSRIVVLVQPFRVQFKKSYKWAMEASAIEFNWKGNNAIQTLIEKPSWGACPGTSRKGIPNKALIQA
jgi:hypothetical protein